MGRSHVFCRWRFAVILGPAMALLLLCTTSGHAQATPDQVAAFLRSAIWWEDIGSFAGNPFGYVYIFGPDQQADGWYIGTRVTYQRVESSTLGFAWLPFVSEGLQGVVIDRAFSREEFIFTGFNPQLLALSWNSFSSSGNRSGQWWSTCSPLTPGLIQNRWCVFR
jgi:hypothetical protein